MNKLVVIYGHRLNPDDVRRVFPNHLIVSPGTALVGHRFEQIVLLGSPENVASRLWENESVRTRLTLNGVFIRL